MTTEEFIKKKGLKGDREKEFRWWVGQLKRMPKDKRRVLNALIDGQNFFKKQKRND